MLPNNVHFDASREDLGDVFFVFIFIFPFSLRRCFLLYLLASVSLFFLVLGTRMLFNFFSCFVNVGRLFVGCLQYVRRLCYFYLYLCWIGLIFGLLLVVLRLWR